MNTAYFVVTYTRMSIVLRDLSIRLRTWFEISVEIELNQNTLHATATKLFAPFSIENQVKCVAYSYDVKLLIDLHPF